MNNDEIEIRVVNPKDGIDYVKIEVDNYTVRLDMRTYDDILPYRIACALALYKELDQMAKVAAKVIPNVEFYEAYIKLKAREERLQRALNETSLRK